jgi:hypothetical protein
MLKEQEINFREKIDYLKLIVSDVQSENGMLKQIITKNDDKLKKYHEVKTQCQ